MEVECSFCLPLLVTTNYFIDYLIIIPDKQRRAKSDVWLVGDRFLKGLWPSIMSSKMGASASDSNNGGKLTGLPYLFNNYNVIQK